MRLVLQALDAKSVFIELQFDGQCDIEPVLCNQLSNFSKKLRNAGQPNKILRFSQANFMIHLKSNNPKYLY